MYTCEYCDDKFTTEPLSDKHKKTSKYCLKLQDKIKKLKADCVKDIEDVKKYYELSLLNLQTRLFELQGDNICLKSKVKKLTDERIKLEQRDRTYWFF